MPRGIEYRRLRHASFCYGYRLASEGKIIAFCTDTGTCKNLSLLAAKADLFIAESAYKIGQVNNKWPHLNPEQAARVAKAAGCKKLALLHFDAFFYPEKRDRQNAQKAAQRIFKNTLAADDGLVVDL